MSEDEHSNAALELISFEIAGQEFCLDIRSVREIRGWLLATPVPQAADYVKGVMNLRGLVVPVIDLKSRLGFGATQPTSRHVIVVIQHHDRVVGLLVDAVQEAFQVDSKLVQPPPSVGEISEERFVDGIFAMEDRTLSRLVVGALLPPEARAAA